MRDDDEFTPDVIDQPRHRMPPRNTKAGRWGIAWYEGARDGTAETGNKICRDCREPAAILHSVGNDIARTHCGRCQGIYNRSRL